MHTYPEGPVPSRFLPTHNTAITTTHAETLISSLVEDRLFFEKASSQTHMEQQYV